VLRTVACLWHRMVHPFDQWPFLLGRLFDPSIEGVERDRIIRSFSHCKPECFERGLGAQLRRICGPEGQHLREPSLLEPLKKTFQAASCTNIQNENRLFVARRLCCFCLMFWHSTFPDQVVGTYFAHVWCFSVTSGALSS
jgi:hypothetical protein